MSAPTTSRVLTAACESCLTREAVTTVSVGDAEPFAVCQVCSPERADLLDLDDPADEVDDPADVRFAGVVALPSDRRDVTFVAAGMLAPVAAAGLGWTTAGPVGLLAAGTGALLVVVFADVLRGRS